MKLSGGIFKSIRFGTLIGILLAISLLVTSLPPTIPKAVAEDGQSQGQTEKETGQDKETNQPPAASAGADQAVQIGDVVTLDGSSSTDPEGNPLTFSWKFLVVPQGSSAALDDPTSAIPKFTVDLPGSYVLAFVVNDGDLDSQPGTVVVTVKDADKDKEADQDQPKEESPVAPPELGKTSVLAKADQEAEMESTSKKLKVKIPKGAVEEDLQMHLIEHGQWGARGAGLLNVFELNAFASQRGMEKVNKFKKNLQITIQHDESDLAGLDIDSLKLCYLDEQTGQWVPVADSKFDKESGILSATTDHFSFYAEQANPAISGPGMVLASQVDLHSGTASYGYPIELPPGSGGFTPKLELTYNSGVADEMKNKREVGSWVGIGWTLELGSISYDPSGNRYYLKLNGTSHKLVQGGDGVTYYTLPDSFYKITRSGNTWNMYDTEGKYYRFGGTSDSQQYYDSSVYYRWDLSYIQDTNTADTVSISYVQDTYSSGGLNHVRSAYPSHVYYNNNHVDIQFNSSANRSDNPQAYGSNPAPKTVENKRLDSIEIKVDGSLLRKYVFAYNTTASTYSSDYGGIYYSGTHTLTSITQKDKNDSLQLPAITFSYQSIQTHLRDTNTLDYNGNPGNPANFYWPHLTSVSNGYGATVNYTYTQIPNASTDNIWTREVVTAKTVNPGIGLTQTTTYSYTGNPQYLTTAGNKWEAEYRGFGQVRETDASGNYTDHWFYTVDANDGNAEKLTGREYKTEWRSADGTLLRQVNNDWQWRYTAEAYSTLRNRIGSDSGQAQFNYPSDIAMGSNGYIYVADTSNHRIQVFNNAYVLMTTWGGYGQGDGQFYNPQGIDVDGSGYVYVADSDNNRIQKFTSSGVFVTKWGSCGTGSGQFNYPYGIAAGSDGYIYVADTGNSRIQKFTSSGGFVTSWYAWGSGSSLQQPNGVAVSNDGYVYVADTGNHRIQKFTTEGYFLTGWGTSYYGSGDGQFFYPSGVAVGNDGYIYVADSNNYRVQKFTSSGTFVTKWGSYGDGDGQFGYPRGITMDSSGYIYVADTNNHRIQKFTGSGTFVAKWGSYGSGGFNQYGSPYGVAAGNDGYIYAIDNYNNCIKKFSSTGTFVTRWGSQGSGYMQFNSPRSIAVSSDGYIYVADTGNARIQKFNSAGTLVGLWGGFGNNDYQFCGPYGVAVSNDGYVYVTDWSCCYVKKFTSSGTFVTKWGSGGTGDSQFSHPYGIAVDSGGYIYVVDNYNSRIQKFTGDGVFVTKWGSQGTGDDQFYYPESIAADSEGHIYVGEGSYARIKKFTNSGTFVTKWGSSGNGDDQLSSPYGIAMGSDGYIYVANAGNNRVQKFTRVYTTYLNKVEETIGSKTSRTRYVYDNYNNVVTQYQDGDLSTGSDDSTVYRTFNPNTTANILTKPSRERVYSGIQSTDDGGANLKAETLLYYDSQAWGTPPTVGNLTRVEKKKDASSSVSAYYTYDSYGNILTETDAKGNVWTTTWDSTYHTYPSTIASPISGQTESYSFDPGTSNLLSRTDINGQSVTYEYDTFKRLVKVVKPGDSSGSPTMQYLYNTWGTLNQQNLESRAKVPEGDGYLWSKQYFDGIGRVIQTQSEGESGHTIINATATFNNRGLVDKAYVSQDIASVLTQYYAPQSGWKYSTPTYDGLGRVTSTTAADGTTSSTDYSVAWQQLATNERGYKKRYTNDAFGRLVKVEELDASQALYGTTTYSYDVLGNLTQLVDNSSNTTTMTYDWLSRKTAMTDPDMGGWSYAYDSNGNLTSQTDAKAQTITLSYDALNRLAAKTYPAGSGMTNITYTYDSTADGNFGKGFKTSMTDAAGTTAYKYDARGRTIQEKRTIDSSEYVTGFAYDSGDRLATVTYPTGETVTQAYSQRGLPNTLSGSMVGNLVTGMTYNQLGEVTEINLGNGAQTNFGYWDVGGGNDTTGGYYGRLWKINTTSGGNTLQNVTHTWDAGGNLSQRQDTVASETETFGYDFLDRLVSASGAYTQSYSYNQIGNITAMNGSSYSYGSKPHAVTAVGAQSYTYDSNGNMTDRNGQTITWDVENKPASVTTGGSTATFVYDGDGNRIKKTEAGETTLYVNQYYDKNLTTSEVTTHYYLGGKEIAFRKGTTLEYLHTDHLGSTSVTSNSSGAVIDTVKYFPFGGTRSSTAPLDTDKLFTGQRLDQTGLYFYNARYYDATIGRFISPDTEVPNPANPQSLNRYSYCLNNPLRYIDPSGHDPNPDIDPGTGINWGHNTETGTPNWLAYVFVGGSSQKSDSHWGDVAAGLGISLDDVLFVSDSDSDNLLRFDDL
ncbi:MAG: RHS repeat-associated core domain-containing protein [Dehalococcoidia bacterium]